MSPVSNFPLGNLSCPTWCLEKSRTANIIENMHFNKTEKFSKLYWTVLSLILSSLVVHLLELVFKRCFLYEQPKGTIVPNNTEVSSCSCKEHLKSQIQFRSSFVRWEGIFQWRPCWPPSSLSQWESILGQTPPTIPLSHALKSCQQCHPRPHTCPSNSISFA